MPDHDETTMRDISLLPDSATEADKRFLQELSEWIQNGEVSVENNSDPYFLLLESRYPIGFNRIDWSNVNNSLFHEVMSFDLPEYPLEYRLTKLAEARGVLVDWLRTNSIHLDDKIIVIGDDSKVALHMSAATFLKCYSVLFTSGQHVYVVPADGGWCLHYSMEDTLNFGMAKDAKAVGNVNSGEDDAQSK